MNLTPYALFIQQALKYGFSLFGTAKTGAVVSQSSGDDGELQKGYPKSGPRFTDNGDGTITDNATGLMWVQDGYANQVTDPATAHTVDGDWWKYTMTNAIYYCERLVYAGYDDWRLPNLKELFSIADFGKLNPCIDENFFTGTKSSGYRSSTYYVTPGVGSFTVSFSYGAVGSGSVVATAYVRPVRLG